MVKITEITSVKDENIFLIKENNDLKNELSNCQSKLAEYEEKIKQLEGENELLRDELNKNKPLNHHDLSDKPRAYDEDDGSVRSIKINLDSDEDSDETQSIITINSSNHNDLDTSNQTCCTADIKIFQRSDGSKGITIRNLDKINRERAKCPICPCVCDGYQAIYYHFQYVHLCRDLHYTNYNYKCHLCDNKFIHMHEIIDHVKLHLNNVYACDHCNRLFKSPTALHIHTGHMHSLNSQNKKKRPSRI